MQEQNNTSKMTRIVALGALIAAVYAVLTYITAPISFGPIQFRVSEALCVLPVFTVAGIPGVTIGCFLANFLSGAMPMDVVFGTLATFIGAIGTRALRKTGPFAAIPPILSNALIIPFVLRYAYGVPDLIPFMMLTVGLGEVISVGLLGNLFRVALIRAGAERFLTD